MLLQKLSSNKVDYSQVKDKSIVIKNSTSKLSEIAMYFSNQKLRFCSPFQVLVYLEIVSRLE